MCSLLYRCGIGAVFNDTVQDSVYYSVASCDTVSLLSGDQWNTKCVDGTGPCSGFDDHRTDMNALPWPGDAFPLFIDRYLKHGYVWHHLHARWYFCYILNTFIVWCDRLTINGPLFLNRKLAQRKQGICNSAITTCACYYHIYLLGTRYPHAIVIILRYANPTYATSIRIGMTCR